MMRGSFCCVFRSTMPVALFGLLLLGWLNMLKKSAVNRRLTDSVKWKFLNTEASEFQFRGPMKNARAFQLTVSVIGVRRTVPFDKVTGMRLSNAAPTGFSTRAFRST